MTDGKYCYAVDNPNAIYCLEENYRSVKAAFILPAHVTAIYINAFRNSAATAVVLPDGVEEISSCAFEDCKNLEAVYIPKSVKKIYSGAFRGCDNLTVYCEGESQSGWVEEEPRYEEQYVYTDEDYAFDFHRGGVNMTCVSVDVSKNWNRDCRPVVTNFPREKFMTEFKKLLENNY